MRNEDRVKVWYGMMVCVWDCMGGGGLRWVGGFGGWGGWGGGGGCGACGVELS